MNGFASKLATMLRDAPADPAAAMQRALRDLDNIGDASRRAGRYHAAGIPTRDIHEHDLNVLRAEMARRVELERGKR